jgi:hypothetical protein
MYGEGSHLNNSLFTINLKNLSTTGSSIAQTNIDNLLIFGSLMQLTKVKFSYTMKKSVALRRSKYQNIP